MPLLRILTSFARSPPDASSSSAARTRPYGGSRPRPGVGILTVALWQRLSTIWAIYPNPAKSAPISARPRCAIGRVDVRDVSQAERCAERHLVARISWADVWAE